MACDPAPGDGDEVETFRAAKQNTLNTGGFACRSCGFTNSPHVGDEIVEAFYVGQGDPSHPLLIAIEDQNGKRYDAEILENGLIAANTASGQITNGAVVGWSLVFEIDEQERLVEIFGYDPQPDWRDGYLIPTYSLAHEPIPGEGIENVCPGLSLETTTLVLERQQRIDGEQYVTIQDGDAVGVYCVGHIGAKLKFMGLGTEDTYGSNEMERTAAVKMLAAAYCPDGPSFTTAGTPIEYYDAYGYSSAGGTVPGAMEARWDHGGAICLGQPRHTGITLEDVEAACGYLPPPCGPEDDGNFTTIVPFAP